MTLEERNELAQLISRVRDFCYVARWWPYLPPALNTRQHLAHAPSARASALALAEELAGCDLVDHEDAVAAIHAAVEWLEEQPDDAPEHDVRGGVSDGLAPLEDWRGRAIHRLEADGDTLAQALDRAHRADSQRLREQAKRAAQSLLADADPHEHPLDAALVRRADDALNRLLGTEGLAGLDNVEIAWALAHPAMKTLTGNFATVAEAAILTLHDLTSTPPRGCESVLETLIPRLHAVCLAAIDHNVAVLYEERRQRGDEWGVPLPKEVTETIAEGLPGMLYGQKAIRERARRRKEDVSAALSNGEIGSARRAKIPGRKGPPVWVARESDVVAWAGSAVSGN